jgi:hypothetical protein
MRGGTYKGKFRSSLNGAVGNLITVRSYPGEWAVIDGYVTASLTTAINNTTRSITLSNGSNFNEGDTFTFHDGVEGSEEMIYLNGKSGNTFTSCNRGWAGRTPVSHAAGATLVQSGDQLYVSGSYTIYRDFEIKNSDPVRQQTPADSQNAPHMRGEGIFNVGALNQYINLVIHDCQEGYFNGDAGIGATVYGNIIYNNGYVADGAFNGQGLYLIHSNAANTAFIRDNIVFNNSNMGIKGDSQNGDAINIWSEGNVAFNNGSWANDGIRKFNLLMASNNGFADSITVKNNFLYHPNNHAGGSARMGLGGGGNGRLTFTGNYLGGGSAQLEIALWSNITFTGNTIAAGTAFVSNDQVIAYNAAAGATVNWNNNSYFNNTTNTRGFFYNVGGSSLSFSQWKSSSGVDAASTHATGNPSATAVFVRANAHDPNQANIIVYNWGAGGTVNVNLASVLANGDSYSIYSTENLFGAANAQGVYAGGTVSLPMSAATV